MNTRALVIFLGINVVCSVVIGYKYFSKDNEQKTANPIIKQQGISSQPSITSKGDLQGDANQNSMSAIEQSKINPITPKLENSEDNSMVQHIIKLQGGSNNNKLPVAKAGVIPGSNPINLPESKDTSKVCTILGPLELKDKATMDVLLSKDSSAGKNQVEISQKPIFEIYWNLGKDREEAEKLFQKQKQNGTMQEDKFILMQDENKDWIVSVAEVNSSLDYAKTVTTQLATTGSKYNVGGKWNYRTKPSAYFYQFNDYSVIDDKTNNSINVMLGVNKTPC